MYKLRVGVLMGGRTIEKEVSFNSGRTVCDRLDTARYDIIPIYQTSQGSLYKLPWHFLHRGKTTDFEHRLDQEAQHLTWSTLKSLVDFIYIASHGRYMEDGIIQGMLEVLRIPYLGSKVLASALGMDKIVHKTILQANGITVPKGINLTPEQINNYNEQTIIAELNQAGVSLPYVVKPHKEGSSFGTSIVYKAQDLYQALHKAMTTYPNKHQSVLIEEKIEGMEFSCITITDYKTGTLLPLPPTEIVPDSQAEFYDYEQKYMPGKSIKHTPARTSPENITNIQTVCARVMTLLGITNCSRIDGFITQDNKIVIIDPNSFSGVSPTSFLFRQAAEIHMSATQLINHLIETELHHYGMLDILIAQEKKEAQAMKNQKLRVAVLMGGPSNEREISLESGRNVTYKLSPQTYDVIPLFVHDTMELYRMTQSQLVRNSTKEIVFSLQAEQRITWDDLPHIADFVFIGLHGGEGENGSVQGALEMLNIPYNGSSVLASALCMDKYKTTEFLRNKGFDVPQAHLIDLKTWSTEKETVLATITNSLPFPVIVKPHDDGCSVMVYKAKTSDELAQALDDIFAHDKIYAMVEEFIIGMELTVGVIGNDAPRALPPSQAVAAGGILSIEEKFLPGAGENQTPAPLPAETLTFVQKTVADVYKALGCKGYSRIDCFYQTATQSPTGTERVVILENNSLPGLTPATCIFHQAAEVGIKPMDFIDLIVRLGMEEHRKDRAVAGKDAQQTIDFTH